MKPSIKKPSPRSLLEFVAGFGLVFTLGLAMVVERQWRVQPAEVLEEVKQLRAEISALRAEVQQD